MRKKVGLIELPAPKLLDPDGNNWTALRQHEPLGGKQILAGSLCTRFDVELVNLKMGDDSVEMGEVEWRGMRLKKKAVGVSWRTLDPARYDVWGVTTNYLQEREIACAIISHLASAGARVVAGGSDAFAEPQPYLDAGATVIVLDKSGRSNVAAMNIALGIAPEGTYLLRTREGDWVSGNPRLHPEEWSMPSVEFVRQTLGTKYWEGRVSDEMLPIGAIMLDHGCDRHCDFCETPTYKLGYQHMSPKRTREWLALQKEAGARSFVCLSDQFLGRVLWKTGRSDVLEITRGFRELGLPVLWGNGLELAKATLGRGVKNSDSKPDRELVEGLWGWDGKTGCAQAYIPAERPLEGSKSYAKLLTWQSHVELLKAIVSAGVPDLAYGVIVGLPEDSNESLSRLIDAIVELKTTLKQVNPRLRFRVTPFAVRPIPGTTMAANLRTSGLLRFTDPAILGGFWTACADTKFLRYEEVSDWQMRIIKHCSDDKNVWANFDFDE